MTYKQMIIFSDIHASLGALCKINDYMRKNDIAIALNLGDFVSNGQYTCEVFDQLMNDNRFINIKGYDEEALFDENKRNSGIAQGEWLIKTLGRERMKKLEALPSMREITVGGKRILMCHNNGWAELKQLDAHSKKALDKRYDLIACGGSHRQTLTYSKELFRDSMQLDPGALKPNDEHQGKFAVVDLQGREFEITFHTIQINEIPREKVKKEVEEKVEQVATDKEEEVRETFLYINGKKNEETSRICIDDEVIDKIIDIGTKKCKYVCIGCWKQEKRKIKEILFHLKCRAIKSSDEDDQEWYIGEMTDEVKVLLKKKRKDEQGRLKWFEISFQNNVDDASAIYSIYHYGKESFLRQLTASDLYNMEQLLERYNILYYLPEDENKKEQKEDKVSRNS